MSLDVGTEARCLVMESHHSSPGLPVSIITKRKKESLLLVFYYSSLAHTLTETINFKRTVTWVPRNDFHSHQCPDYVLCPILSQTTLGCCLRWFPHPRISTISI